MVAWILPTGVPARLVLGLAHTDSPCLRLRPEAESVFCGCRKLSVEAYGGLLNHAWLDRELEVAGRVCLEEPGASGKSWSGPMVCGPSSHRLPSIWTAP